MEKERKPKITKEEKKKAKAEKRKKLREEGKGIVNEFRKFISRGNVVDLAVGVIIGSAFSAIVTALTNIFLSICTWWIPGGLSGLVTCLPATNAAQAGVAGIGQSFASSELEEMTIIFAATRGAEGLEATDANFMDFQNALLSNYTNHGGTYYYNGANLIDWGAFLNAVITFLLIAVVLFLIVKAINMVHKKADAIKAAQLEAYYVKHPDERPAPVVEGAPKLSETDLLIQIRDELKKSNESKVKISDDAGV